MTPYKAWTMFFGTILIALVIENHGYADLDSMQSRAENLDDNLFYQTMRLSARKVTQQQCYVCSFTPTNVKGSVPMITVPLNSSEVLGALIALGSTKDGRTVQNKVKSKLDAINEVATSFVGYKVRLQNVSQVEDKIGKLLFKSHPSSYTSQVCFEQTCDQRKRFLGTSLYCNQIVPAACGLNDPLHLCKGRLPTPYWTQLNISFPLKPNATRPTNPWVYTPSTDGFGALQHHVWACGQNVYQILPPGWCGLCHMAKLVPDLRIVNNLTYFHTQHSHFYPSGKPIQIRDRRDTRISAGNKFMNGLVPWYGTVSNSHAIDALALDLENLTALVTEGFDALRPEIKALRTVALENRFALDYLLSSSGGVCHIIGRECCSFIPDATDNLTNVVDHLNVRINNEDLQQHPLVDMPQAYPDSSDNEC